MKTDRLLGIIMYLLNRNIVSAAKLAKQFNVSVRTIQRDIDSLTMAGIPIVSYQGSAGGYGIIENFKLDQQIMDLDDYLYIIKALKSLSTAYENKKISKAIERIKAIIPENNSTDLAELNTKFSLDFSVAKENDQTRTVISLLEGAIEENKLVQYNYINSNYQNSERTVEPLSIIYKWYSWYLLAYCHQAGDYRLFRISRIRDLLILDREHQYQHQNINMIIEKYFASDDRNYLRIRMLCQPEIRVSIEEYFANGRIIEEENGQFIFEISLPEDEKHWFGKILSYGNKIKVLEPASLQQKILTNIQQIKELYVE